MFHTTNCKKKLLLELDGEHLLQKPVKGEYFVHI